MRKLSNEQIGAIERELASAFGSVELQCDAYRVRVEVRPVKARTYALAVFVNGWFKGEWLMNDCEERRRFLQPKTIRLYTPTQRAEFIKVFGKRAAARHVPNFDATKTFWSSYWTSVRSMLRHFCANNTSVEVVRIGITEILGKTVAEAGSDNV